MNAASISESNILENLHIIITYSALLLPPYKGNDFFFNENSKTNRRDRSTGHLTTSNRSSKPPFPVIASRQTEKQLFQTFRLNLLASKLSRLRAHNTFDRFLPTLRKSHDRRKKRRQEMTFCCILRFDSNFYY